PPGELVTWPDAGSLDRHDDGVRGADPHIRTLELSGLATAQLDVFRRRVLRIPFDPLALCAMTNLCIILSFETAANLEEAEALLWVGASLNVVLRDAQAAQETGKHPAASARAVISANDDAVE